VENQHRKIAGYRDLSQADVDLMNEIKALEEHVASVYRKLTPSASDVAVANWLDTGRTHLETGFMYLLKAVARPDNGLGRA
jgi:hypothetical protein